MYECMNVWVNVRNVCTNVWMYEMYKRMNFNKCMNLLGMMNNYWKNTIKYRIRLPIY